MNATSVAHYIIIVGFVLIAICVPPMVIWARGTPAAAALSVMVWFLCAAAVARVTAELRDEHAFDFPDWLRLAAVASFVAFLALYRRGRYTDEP